MSPPVSMDEDHAMAEPEIKEALAEQLDEGSDDSAEDDDSDDSDEEDVQISNAELAKLEKAVQDNPRDYDAHVLVVNALRSTGDLARVRLARDAFSHEFPLSEELWRTWLMDERRSAVTPKQKHDLISLYKRACADYYSFNLVVECTKFAVALFESTLALAKHDDGGDNERVVVALRETRDLFDWAVSLAGHDLVNGHKVWTSAIQFEKSLAKRIDPRRVQHLLLGLISAPSSEGHEDALNKLEAQLIACGEPKNTATQVVKRANASHAAAKTEIETRLELRGRVLAMAEEQGLMSKGAGSGSAATPELLALLEAYTDLEERCGIELKADGGRSTAARLAHEEAVSLCCLAPQLWKRLVDYAVYGTPTFENDDKDDGVLSNENCQYILESLERAVRNCPWDAGLWVSYLQAVERDGCVSTKHDDASWRHELIIRRHAVLRRARQALMNAHGSMYALELEYCSGLRRMLARSVEEGQTDKTAPHDLLPVTRAAFQESVQVITATFPTLHNGRLALMIAQATCEYDAAGEITSARALWDEVLTSTDTTPAEQVNNWTQAIAFYSQRKQYATVREFYAASLDKLVGVIAHDIIQDLCRQWIQFEQTYATSIKQLDYAQKQVRVSLQRSTTASPAGLGADDAENPFGLTMRGRHKKKPNSKKTTELHVGKSKNDSTASTNKKNKGQKRGRDEAVTVSLPPTTIEPSTDTTASANTEEHVDIKHAANDSDDANKRRKTETKQPPKAVVQAATDSTKVPSKERSVFVLNLPYDATPEQLSDVFAVCGKVMFVKLRKHLNGRGKGMGDVCFKQGQTPDPVQTALAMNGQVHLGRVLQVKPQHFKSDDGEHKDKNGQKGAARVEFIEELSVRVVGLPIRGTSLDSDLRKNFGVCGIVTDIRVNLNKESAFVQFTEASAAQAALKLDKQKLDFSIKSTEEQQATIEQDESAGKKDHDEDEKPTTINPDIPTTNTLSVKVRVQKYIAPNTGRRAHVQQQRRGDAPRERPRRQRIAMPLVPTSVVRLRPRVVPQPQSQLQPTVSSNNK